MPDRIADPLRTTTMKKLFLIGLFLAAMIWALMSYPGLSNQGTYDSLILNFADDIPNEQIEQELSAIANQYGTSFRLNSAFSTDENLYLVEGDQALLKQLRRSELAKETEAIEPNYQYSTLAIPNDPDYSKQWNLRAIGMEKAWEETQGEGVVVAVIDTGVSRVPDLKDTKFVKGYDFVNDREDASDDNGHGTHVAGTIAQSTNNKYGVAGIAFKASIMPLKVLSGSGGGSVADIAEAIRYAADNGADVINMSLGGPGDTDLLRTATEYAYRKGVVIIAAAGNEQRNSASYPARYPHVLAVAALDSTGQKAPYSNFGAGVDISAPGGSLVSGEAGGILQNTINPQSGESIFSAFQGTSMAAPHVAGVAALIKAQGVETPDEVYEILRESSQKVENDTFNHFGAGQLNAAEAVRFAGHGKISLRHFFRWLVENGYLNLKFWFDGGVVALLPKLAMVVGSYLLAWLLRVYLPLVWTWPLSWGLIMGSTGLFLFRGLYIWDLPQWPFRVAGSAFSEWGNVIQGSSLLNPIFASALIPLVLLALLLGHPKWKWFMVGTSLGMAVFLGVSAIADPGLMWLGQGIIARGYLALNALLCYGLAYLATKTETKPA